MVSYQEWTARALNFMVENYGRPIDLEDDARERWHEQLGVLMHFVNVACRADRTTTDRDQEE